MHDSDSAPPVRVPVLVQQHLGQHGWAHLHLLADLHGRPPRLEALALIRWAIWRSLAGEATDLTPAQFATMLGSLEPADAAEAIA
jgi:hypothetical protein